MEIQEIRDLTVEELSVKEKELRKELFNLRYQIIGEGVTSPQRIKDARREIARIKTVVWEKQLSAAESSKKS